jgi:hypothetical protein
VRVQVKNRDDATTPEAIFQEAFMEVENRKTPDLASTKKRKGFDLSIGHRRKKVSNVLTDSSTRANVPIRNGPNFVFNKMTNPILFLLFDIGITRANRATAPPVQVSYSSNDENSPRLWAVHSRGHGNTVFRCLELMDCMGVGRIFFTTTASGDNSHHKLAKRNELFYELRRGFRYSPVDAEGDVQNK